MLLTCENCETIFRIESAQLKTPGQQVRCSVCKHVWAPQIVAEDPAEPQLIRESMGVLRWPLVICAFVIAAVMLTSFNRGIITAYLPSLVPAFDMTGLVIRPDLERLEVQDLKASYAGDVLRVSGLLANTSNFRTHAAPLQLTISDDDGVVLHSQRIIPTDAIIQGAQTTDFFIQLEIEQTSQAEVSLVPLAIRLDTLTEVN